MAYYLDMSPCEEVSAEPWCLAVGWLARGRDYLRGDVDEAFFKRLCELLIEPWSFAVTMGVHPCEFCRFSGGFNVASNGDLKFHAVASGLLFVPSGSNVFVAPTNIAHYVDAHEYCPPEEFCRAVMECPAMNSMPYKRAILATPVKGLMRAGRG
jgi:hypothetical protein